MPFTVMTSAGGSRRGHGNYRNVAVVEYRGEVPKMISPRARGMVRVVRHYGSHYVGRTARCAYHVTLEEARALAQELNNANP